MTRKQTTGNSTEQAEMSLFWVTLKGTPGAINAIAHTAHALAKATLTGANRVVTPKPPVAALTSAVAESDAEQDLEVVEVSVGEEAFTPTPPPVKPARKQRAFSPVESLPSLNVNDAPDPFREFVGAGVFEGQNDRGLVAATWLRDKRGAKQFDVRHMATCFRAMNWKMPDDPGSLLRNMKKSNLVKGAGPGLYELTTVGDNTYSDLIK